MRDWWRSIWRVVRFVYWPVVSGVQYLNPHQPVVITFHSEPAPVVYYGLLQIRGVGGRVELIGAFGHYGPPFAREYVSPYIETHKLSNIAAIEFPESHA